MAEELKNQEVNEEVKDQTQEQENATPETPAKDSEETKTEVKKEGIFAKGKKFCKKYVVPGAKATARVAGKMAIITGGILGAVFVAGISAGLAAKDKNETEEEETNDLDPVDESLSGGDEEIDELLNETDEEDDSEDEDSAEE